MKKPKKILGLSVHVKGGQNASDENCREKDLEFG